MKRLLVVIISLIVLSLISAKGVLAAQPKLPNASAINNAFAFDLLKKIMATDKDKNIFFSPYSISTALAMTFAGARGNTAKEMATVLHYDALGEGVHKAFHILAKDIEKSKTEGYQLNVANALWGQEGYGFRKDFLNLVARYYSGGFNEVDFVGETEKTRNKINDWVMKKTANKIKNLLGKHDINAVTRLVLTNAIYFKGNWASQFKKEMTQKRPFYVKKGKVVDVQMMFKDGKFMYGESNEGLQVLELPYEGDDLSMVILLPRKGLEGFRDIMSPATLNACLSRLEKREVGVFLPKFKFQSKYYLGKILIAMGMRDAFDLSADFSGMTGNTNLRISKVIHQADIDVNEEGTEAAAATAVVMALKSMPSEPILFKADHPFVFLIRHRPTNAILFIGLVMNPNEIK